MSKEKNDYTGQIIAAVTVAGIAGIAGGIFLKLRADRLFREDQLKKLDEEISKNPDRKEELISKFLIEQLEKNTNHKDYTDKLIKEIISPEIFKILLKTAVELKNKDYYAIIKLTPHVTDIETVDLAYRLIKDKDHKTAKEIKKQQEFLRTQTPEFIRIMDAYKHGHPDNNFLHSQIAAIDDQILLKVIMQHALDNNEQQSRKFTSLIDISATKLTNQGMLGKAYIHMATIDETQYLAPIAARINDQDKIINALDESIRLGKSKAVELMLPKVQSEQAIGKAFVHSFLHQKPEQTNQISPYIDRMGAEALARVTNYAILMKQDLAIENLVGRISMNDQNTLANILNYGMNHYNDYRSNQIIHAALPKITDQRTLAKAFMYFNKKGITAQTTNIADKIYDQDILAAILYDPNQPNYQQAIKTILPKITNPDLLLAMGKGNLNQERHNSYLVTQIVSQLQYLGRRTEANELNLALVIKENPHIAEATHHPQQQNNHQAHRTEAIPVAEVAQAAAYETIPMAHAVVTETIPVAQAYIAPSAPPYSEYLKSIPQNQIASSDASGSHSVGLSNPNNNLNSISQTTAFAAQTLLAIAVIFKMLKIKGFEDFVLPSNQAKIQFDRPISENQWASNLDFKYIDDQISKSPEYFVLANAINKEITTTKPKTWSKEEIVNFVNSPKFEETIALTKEMEQSSRRATEADFGIEPSTKISKPKEKKSKTR